MRRSSVTDRQLPSVFVSDRRVNQRIFPRFQTSPTHFLRNGLLLVLVLAAQTQAMLRAGHSKL